MFNFFSKSKKTGAELSKTSKISAAISQIFSHKKLDSEILDELEESLILADIFYRRIEKPAISVLKLSVGAK